jgi:hypothetical protein
MSYSVVVVYVDRLLNLLVRRNKIIPWCDIFGLAFKDSDYRRHQIRSLGWLAQTPV